MTTTKPCSGSIDGGGSEPWKPQHPVVGPPPVFHRGATPYWQAACGCEAAANEWRYCVRHAAAPEMAALLREEYDDTTESTGRADRERRARALLARIDGRHGPYRDEPQQGTRMTS